jgi:hypothetical protein
MHTDPMYAVYTRPFTGFRVLWVQVRCAFFVSSKKSRSPKRKKEVPLSQGLLRLLWVLGSDPTSMPFGRPHSSLRTKDVQYALIIRRTRRNSSAICSGVPWTRAGSGKA